VLTLGANAQKFWDEVIKKHARLAGDYVLPGQIEAAFPGDPDGQAEAIAELVSVFLIYIDQGGVSLAPGGERALKGE
jgi:hypothetical protein